MEAGISSVEEKWQRDLVPTAEQEEFPAAFPETPALLQKLEKDQL